MAVVSSAVVDIEIRFPAGVAGKKIPESNEAEPEGLGFLLGGAGVARVLSRRRRRYLGSRRGVVGAVENLGFRLAAPELLGFRLAAPMNARVPIGGAWRCRAPSLGNARKTVNPVGI